MLINESGLVCLAQSTDETKSFIPCETRHAFNTNMYNIFTAEKIITIENFHSRYPSLYVRHKIVANSIYNSLIFFLIYWVTFVYGEESRVVSFYDDFKVGFCP